MNYGTSPYGSKRAVPFVERFQNGIAVTAGAQRILIYLDEVSEVTNAILRAAGLEYAITMRPIADATDKP